ncbi:hypothetical protein ABOM_003478 [Aspergillus bombycis]|uniref:RRM domain-containing protein n=1 Tax=Aspergillus bombycis TaxID=109264 RepID=A0A1F8AAB8_9EURO|nr:hypothetical protein ABOM_003478 [Aspergillus bombycis]OGM48325.1 hypothetical protein ABOM_003478 [Aspergillus bombycis]
MATRHPVDPFTGHNSPGPHHGPYRGREDTIMQPSQTPEPGPSGTPNQQGQFPSLKGLYAHLPSMGEAARGYYPYDPAQTPTPTPRNPHPFSQLRAVHSPLPAPVPQHPFHYGPPGLLSPAFYPAEGTMAPQPMRARAQGQEGNFEHIPDLNKPFSTVAMREEMPIGSSVHTRQAPRWGVIKISNIPYSVTKNEIAQFVGRPARLIKGCPIHIIMERSTAKTMDCFVETETQEAAQRTVDRINSIYETGRAPRLGLRRVDVEYSNQDALLKDLFPRAKCISWEDGMPIELPNTDPYSTGFSGFITSEEIVGAIRHAEIPHRSPFSVKCPQRTYESTISTLYKYPWYAPMLYTVDDRNQLFDLTNRHLISLASRIDRTQTMGLDQNLLRDLLYAGFNCPAFNERQKYTLCVNSNLAPEIARIPDISKWFPFDTLVQLPDFNKDTILYYANLISRGTIPDHGIPHLTNTFPQDRNDLRSPYGRVWFEWPADITKKVPWENAVRIEMQILGNLVLTGWVTKDNEAKARLAAAGPSSSTRYDTRRTHSGSVASPEEGLGLQTSSRLEIFATPSRRVTKAGPSHRSEREEADETPRPFNDSDQSPWTRRFLMFPPGTAREGFNFGHRNTKSSPGNLTPSGV